MSSSILSKQVLIYSLERELFVLDLSCFSKLAKVDFSSAIIEDASFFIWAKIAPLDYTCAFINSSSVIFNWEIKASAISSYLLLLYSTLLPYYFSSIIGSGNFEATF